MDKEVVLAFVNGPGTSLAFMWFVLLLFFFGLFAVRRLTRVEEIRRQAKEDAQRGLLQNVNQTLNAMKHDQELFMRKQLGRE